jgi:DNA-binding NtrC family response regulator
MQATEQKVLIVDDDAAVALVLQAGLLESEIAADCAGSAEEALVLLQRRQFDVILTDVKMPGASGLTLLSTLRHQWPDIPVILLTAHGTVRMAVEAMHEGAMDFLTKPFDIDEVVAVVQRALAVAAKRSGRVPAIPISTPGIESCAPTMREVEIVLRRVARSDSTLLLLGESGTGKEVAARWVHAVSARSSKPFIAVHCGALPANLIESELFGYEKGAFTGAAARKPGRLELAEGGTLLLDEIGETSPETQVKLLRVLQEKTFERLGGVTTIQANVRFIAATHRNLVSMVADGHFREDLYYRLSVCPVRLPPLRERREDVVPLVEHFARLHCHDGAPVTFTPEALEVLRSQPWPGNVRQLENLIERVVLLSVSAVIDREAVIDALQSDGGPVPLVAGDSAAGEASLDESVREVERKAVRMALERARGNRTQAARLLGVSRRTLYNKLAEYAIE